MRKVTQKSISEGRITLTIPEEYREVATIICKRSNDSKIPVSAMIWEMIKTHLAEEELEKEIIPFESLAGSLKRYASSYVTLDTAREETRKDVVRHVVKEGLSS